MVKVVLRGIIRKENSTYYLVDTVSGGEEGKVLKRKGGDGCKRVPSV